MKRGGRIWKKTQGKIKLSVGNDFYNFFHITFVGWEDLPTVKNYVLSLCYKAAQTRIKLTAPLLKPEIHSCHTLYVSYLSICSPPLPNLPFITVEAEEVEEERKER